MLFKILIVLVLGFVTLGALRWAMASPRPRWLAPALAGVVTAALMIRFGLLGIAAGAAVAAALWFAQAPRATHRDMKVEDARALLGIGEGASEADIRAAHRRMIATAHPDKGGSAEAAARLNAARDLLLKRRKSGA